MPALVLVPALVVLLVGFSSFYRCGTSTSAKPTKKLKTYKRGALVLVPQVLLMLVVVLLLATTVLTMYV